MELAHCEGCKKPDILCVCVEEASKLDNRTFVLVLQHPQEPDKVLGSAPLLKSLLKNCEVVVALSRPNLSAALKGTSFSKAIDPKSWAVLYMGTGLVKPEDSTNTLFQAIGGSKNLKPGAGRFQGLVVLDGTWSQAKALWWRNPWLTKLQRLVLIPQKGSLYGQLRKEPRKEALSTLESVALTLGELGDGIEIKDTLLKKFSTFLYQARKIGVKKGQMPKPLAPVTSEASAQV